MVIRPSYVLGGRAMEIVYDRAGLHRYMREAVRVSGENPVLIDRYLNDAIEVDVDCIADGETVYVAGVMEHIEEAGIHSGDSACSLPPYTLAPATVTELKVETEALARALGVVGLMNVQYAIKDDMIFVLEVNPRASRTVPFVAKATGVAVAKIGARVMAGARLAEFHLDDQAIAPHVAVKEAVFPFNRFPNVDTILGPEMKSTGEVMGLDASFERAFAKSQLGAGVMLPQSGTVFLSIKDADKKSLPALARRLAEMGFAILATRGTAARIREAGLPVTVVNKVLEGRPHCVDAIRSARGAARHQHRSRPAIGGRQLCHPPQRADPRGAALHHHGRRPGGGACDCRRSGPARLKWRRSSPTFADRSEAPRRPGSGSARRSPCLVAVISCTPTPDHRRTTSCRSSR